MNIYVGNLKFSATEEEIKGLFEQYGTIESIKMITDRQTGRPRGFCFVEMEDSVALTAIEGLNGKELDGRNIQVNEARERKPRNNDNFRSR
ncbi:MAG: RNA-binding protein [FCB group bacterium]